MWNWIKRIRVRSVEILGVTFGLDDTPKAPQEPLNRPSNSAAEQNTGRGTPPQIPSPPDNLASPAPRSKSTLGQGPSRQSFLSKCDPTAFVFFEMVERESEARGHSIDWRQISFSVKAQLNDGQMVTFLQGYSPDKFHVDLTEAFQARVSSEVAASLRSALPQLGVFEDCNKKMPRVRINERSVEKARQALNFVLNWMDQNVLGR